MEINGHTPLCEDYVSFETAKLLKEKGFDAECHSHYYPCHYPDGSIEYYRDKGTQRGDKTWYNVYSLKNLPKDHYLAPTLQMAMKWLREFHALNIYARGVWKDVEIQYGDWEPAIVGYEWFVEGLTDDTYSKMSTEQFLTYEEACESAIKYCLENLI